MTIDYETAYFRFADFLETRRAEPANDLDIRAHMLAIRNCDVGIGYVERTLRAAYGANLRRLFAKLHALEDVNWSGCRYLLMPGTLYDDQAKSHKGGARLFERLDGSEEVILVEQGFLASTHSWSHAFREAEPTYACLGYVYDDIAHYFMADYPNRLNQRLNDQSELTEWERTRAGALIARIVAQRVSKYNAQPMTCPVMTTGYARRVLVCDQAYADASTVYGKIDDVGFEAMLLAAIRENPGAEILVKSHPDTAWEKGKRAGYYSHLTDCGRVRILRDPVNPYVLFDEVDTVYVGSSQMGLEALFAGKKVVCFGAPFYAGWGLTDDRQSIPHRHRTRSLEDIFHTFYDWYTIYHVPGKPVPSSIEDVLDFIETNRPVSLPPTRVELEAPPKVSIILPVYGVERYLEEALHSIQIQTLREIEIIPVNDMSPDGCQVIIDRLAAEDPRIRPIRLKENIGQGFARNAGIDAVRGEYVWFLDPDDYMPNPAHLETVYEMASRNDSDMVRGRKLRERLENEDGSFKSWRKDSTEKFFEEPVECTTFAKAPQILHSRHFYNWLYRHEFLKANNIRFLTRRWEERPFLLHALMSAQRISISISEGIVYRIRPTSTARNKKSQTDFDCQLENFATVVDILGRMSAFDRDNPMRRHACFTLSQYLHYIFLGFPFQLVQQADVSQTLGWLIDTVAEILDRTDFFPSDLDDTPIALSHNHVQAGAYRLMLAAVLARKPTLVRIAVELGRLPQKLYYQELLGQSNTAKDHALTDALNFYGRNDKIAPLQIKQSAQRERPRIIIHIGATKTGSTYLQHLMENNRPALMRSGIWYPEVGLFWQSDRPQKQAGHAHFARSAIRGDQNLRQYIDAGLIHLGQHVDGGIHTVVLSSEAFFLNAKAECLVEYFEGYEVEIVVYLRRQDDWANAQYTEFVSGGAIGRVETTPEVWLNDPTTQKRLDYLSGLRRWEKMVGRDNLHVRIYDPAELIDGDLQADFATTVGLPALLDLPRPDGVLENRARLSTPHVQALRHFNGQPFKDQRAYLAFIEEVTEGITSWRRNHGYALSKPAMLTVAQRRDLLDLVAEDNAEIARHYLKRSGPLFSDSAPMVEIVELPLYGAEIDIMSVAYRRHGGPEQPAAASLHIARPAPVVPISRLVPAVRTARPKSTIVDYGLFGWRLWALSPWVRRRLVKRGSIAQLSRFDRDPAAFLHESKLKRHRRLALHFYPQRDVFGPLGIFSIWLPVLELVARRYRNENYAAKIRRDPIRFFRKHPRFRYRVLGRILFPIGEFRSQR